MNTSPHCSKSAVIILTQWKNRLGMTMTTTGGGYEFLVKNVFENDFKSLICLVICTQNLVSWIFHHMKTFRKFWYITNYGMNDGNLSFHSEKCRDTFPLCCETFPDCGVPDFTARYRRWLEGMRGWGCSRGSMRGLRWTNDNYGTY